MIQILIKDPANPYRDGWHNINDNGATYDSLAGNIKKIFLTDIPFSVPTSSARQPDNWSCGPYAMAEALGHSNGETERAILLSCGGISYDYGTVHSGINYCLNRFGYKVISSLWQNWFNGVCGYIQGFMQLVNHLATGKKAILLMGGLYSGAGGRCRNSYWSNAGHYICAYGIRGEGIQSSIGSPSETPKPVAPEKPQIKYCYSFNLSDIDSTNTPYKEIVFLQKILKVKGYYKGEFNGQYNLETIEAIKKYQKEQKITADGKITSATWKKLLGNIVTGG